MISSDHSSPELGEPTILSSRTAVEDLPRLTVAIRWIIGILGVGLVVWMIATGPAIASSHFWIYVISLVLLEAVLSIRMAPAARFHLGFAFLIVYFQLVGAAGAAILIIVDRISAWAYMRVRKERRETIFAVFFDVGLHILAVLAGAALVSVVLGTPLMQPEEAFPLASMVLFAGGFLVGTSALTSLAVYSRFGFVDLRTRLWPATVLWSSISVVISLPLAAITWNLIEPYGAVGAAMIMLGLCAALSLILKLNSGLVKINREQRAINRIGNLLNSTLSTKELFKVVATGTRQILPWDRFFVALKTDEEQLEIVFIDASGSQTRPRSVPLGVGLTGRAMSAEEVIHYEADEADGEQVGDFESTTGRRRPRSIVVAPMRFGEQVIGAIGVQSFRSDTYRRSHHRLLQTIAAQAATAIRNAQLFESERLANEERDEFISVVTHEIKSPLTSISGYAELARESAERNDQRSVDEYLDVVKAESGKILRLVEDLLDASRMESGHFSIEMDSVNLDSLISRIVDRHGKTCSQSIEFRRKGSVPLLQADPVRIGQVVDNLVSNACKYAGEGANIVVTLADQTDMAEIVVADDGEGIDPEQLPRIFERFYRVREAQEDAKGTGLGLYITKRIVEMHGGSIEVESKPGAGTTFIVRIPIRMD